MLYGVSVAEIGEATGHYAFLDKAGKVVGVGGSADADQFKTAARRLPLCMDQASLDSVIVAAALSQRVKTREDHDDSIESRAGYAQNFRIEGNRVICDQKIFDNYANRAVFLETASETPELIGLSGDFKFLAEVVGDKAMMRVTRIDAVDIVDEGALTHGGLFSIKAAAAVDMPNSQESKTFSIMANSPEVPDFKAFKALCESVAAYKVANAASAKQIDDCMAALLPTAISPSGVPVEPPQATTAALSALKTELTATFAAEVAKVTESATNAAKSQLVEFRKEMSALGIKLTPAVPPTESEITAAKQQVDDEAAAKLAKANGNDFLSLRAARATEKKISLVKAAQEIAAEKPEVFESYRVKLGIVKAK